MDAFDLSFPAQFILLSESHIKLGKFSSTLSWVAVALAAILDYAVVPGVGYMQYPH